MVKPHTPHPTPCPHEKLFQQTLTKESVDIPTSNFGIVGHIMDKFFNYSDWWTKSPNWVIPVREASLFNRG
ncbi:hypothetical protein VL20_425 [Microcystis panniformis FACHB-1757]|uniref:Uncharacterized protein n=1 Tax=Microcystis panniformis FACHB-1757 TaxID=1638788 RepID=A0A0K1RUU0_9CHRO|nr:hypothetical protein VL20_425 [Microcystis panniformis FACHB-1757]